MKKADWKRGDVFFAKFRVPNNEHLQDNYRPWLIVQNNTGNKYAPTTIIVPLTTKMKRTDIKTHCIVTWGRIQPSVVLCEQIRTVDFTPGWKYLDTLPAWIMAQVDQCLKNSLGLK